MELWLRFGTLLNIAHRFRLPVSRRLIVHWPACGFCMLKLALLLYIVLRCCRVCRLGWLRCRYTMIELVIHGPALWLNGSSCRLNCRCRAIGVMIWLPERRILLLHFLVESWLPSLISRGYHFRLPYGL